MVLKSGKVAQAMTYLVELGPHGEVELPEELRGRLGLKPGDKLLCRIEGGAIVMEPLRPRLEELLAREPKVVVSLEEFHEFRRQLSRALEGRA